MTIMSHTNDKFVNTFCHWLLAINNYYLLTNFQPAILIQVIMNTHQTITQKRFSIIKKTFTFTLISLLLINSKNFALNTKTTPPKPKNSIGLKKPDSLQDKISLGNAYEIGYQAVSVVQVLESLLNSITFNDNTETELMGYINNSYTPGQRARVFYSKTTILDDDVNPQFDLQKKRDIAAETYLNDLNLKYEKTPDFSIKFSNFVVSDIKRKDYIYINVKFDESFGSKYKADGTPYPVRTRIAEIRADRHGKKRWDAYIVSIRYYDPNQPITSTDNAVPVVNSDTIAKPMVFSEAQVEAAMGDMVKDKMRDSKKEEMQFTGYITSGDSLFKSKQYLAALDFYIKAEVLRPLSPKVYRKILGTKRILWAKKRKMKSRHHKVATNVNG